ncbi:hypothetical protein EYZ11_009819 [Aspergillus tanneri]|uniref:Uncharacterized protein n=1 Tax=Aspergillus tanneri TaxID=1220188 RepID=A0A4S3J8Z3_9EURO|nr:hypothetical protein EYZ11_009819 [Aspergillus tanneri]
MVSDPFLGYSAAVVATIELQLSFTENPTIREEKLSATYRPESGAQNKSLLIDLSRFWEILEYSSNGDTDSARRMFGDSLYSNSPAFTAEVSQTSPLPEPTRMSTQQGISQSPLPTHFNLQTSLTRDPSCPVESVATSQPADLLNDEFSILAANFFSQGQEFLRFSDNRDGLGNL